MKISLSILSCIALSFAPIFALAKEAPKGPSNEKTAQELFERLTTYRQSLGIKAEVKKSFFKKFADSTEQSEGEIFLMSGRLKIEIKSPVESRSLLVMNSKGIWLETPFEEGFPPTVTKLPTSSLKKSDGIWNVLVGKAPLGKNFNVSASEKDGKKIFLMTPKGKAQFELSRAEVVFTGKDLSTLAYSDQMENKVTYEFSNWKKGSLPMKMFEYTPPKGAAVTEL